MVVGEDKWEDKWDNRWEETGEITTADGETNQ
jgi:hypothetical protein